jgi:hypothetical protein
MDKTVFLLKNPWKRGLTLPAPTIDRPEFDSALALLRQPRVVLVMGPRRVGKTTLTREVLRRLRAGGLASPERTTYLDLDTMDCADVLATPGRVLETIGLDPLQPDQALHYLAIDEIQRLPDAGRLLKGLFDLEVPLRVIASVSSALGLRDKVRESMAGRATTLMLWSLTPPAVPLDGEFLEWGGLPEVRLTADPTQRLSLLADLWAAYVDREIGPTARGDTVSRFREMAILLAGQTGQLVNQSELANSLGVSSAWVRGYLDFLELSFLLRYLRPFTTGKRAELTKMPKVYFTDLGLRRLLAGDLTAGPDAGRGATQENAVEILLRAAGGDLYYWRTVAGAEVDFVWRPAGVPIPIEVKSGPMARPSVPRGLRRFIDAYAPPRALVVNDSLDQEIEVGSCRLRFVPLAGLPGVLASMAS